MMHYFNANEGNGQSHTFCGAVMSVETYRAFLNTPGFVVVCPECDRMATAQDEYAYHYDL